MANEGMLLIVALGALVLSGGKIGKPTAKAGSIVGDTMPREQSGGSGFDIAGYIQGLFGATVPEQPPVTFFYPKAVVVTSSGVPAVVHTAPEIITPTTKVQIGGEGGQTIVNSSLAIIRQEQLDKQLFQAEANVQTPKTEATAAFNRDEESRQRNFADELIKANRDAQIQRNAQVVARTRLEQENIANNLKPDGSKRSLPAGMNVIGHDYSSGPPTINFDEDSRSWTYTNEVSGVTAGQPIGSGPNLDVDFFEAQYTETFVISGGMDSPTTVGVHELTAQNVIGF